MVGHTLSGWFIYIYIIRIVKWLGEYIEREKGGGGKRERESEIA